MRSALLAQIRELPKQPLLIYPPRTRLLIEVLKYWGILFILIAMTVNVFIFVTIPFIAVTLFYYFKLSVEWKVYRYSGKLLHFTTAAVMLGFISITGFVRSEMLTLFTIIF